MTRRQVVPRVNLVARIRADTLVMVIAIAGGPNSTIFTLPARLRLWSRMRSPLVRQSATLKMRSRNTLGQLPVAIPVTIVTLADAPIRFAPAFSMA